jgi:hypothetical protein
VIDRLHPIFGIELLEIGYPAPAHHHAAHLIAALRGLRRMAQTRCVFKIREEVGALTRVLYARERHGITRNEVLRVLDPFAKGVVVPDDAAL